MNRAASLLHSCLAACACLCFLGPLSAVRGATLLVEFGETLAGDGPGGTWNRYTNTAGINGSALRDSFNVLTPITFGFTGNLAVSNNSGPVNAYDNTAAVGNPSWVATPTNNLAAGDLFYTENGSSGIVGEVILLFGGFTAGDVVSIDFLGSRNTGLADGFYSYSIDGGSTWTGFTVLNPDGSLATGTWSGANTLTTAFDNLLDGYQNHRYMNADGVILTGTTLQIKARDISNASGNFAALNAMRLTVVPEPATPMLLALGTMFMLARRRRSVQIVLETGLRTRVFMRRVATTEGSRGLLVHGRLMGMDHAA